MTLLRQITAHGGQHQEVDARTHAESFIAPMPARPKATPKKQPHSATRSKQKTKWPHRSPKPSCSNLSPKRAHGRRDTNERGPAMRPPVRCGNTPHRSRPEGVRSGPSPQREPIERPKPRSSEHRSSRTQSDPNPRASSQAPEKAASEHLWTIEETAEYLNIPVETLRHWRKNKTGPKAARMGRHLRYHPRHVQQWFEACGGAVA